MRVVSPVVPDDYKSVKPSRRVSRERFLQVKAELSNILRDLGYTYRIRRYPAKWSVEATPPGVYGWFREYKRSISVISRGKNGNRQVLYVLAHEVRHAMHVREGLYKSYYGLNYEMIRLFIKGRDVQWKWPNLGVAVRAERDCDTWAAKFLADRGIEQPTNSPYSFHATLAYKTSRELKIHLRNRDRESKRKSSVHWQQPVLYKSG